MRLTHVHPLLIIFVLGFSIRALPEILSGPYPVGYDLLAGYAPTLWAFPDEAPMRAFGWAWSPLAIYVLWFFWKFSGADLYVYLKFVGPVFYGLFVLSFYYLLLKGLGWSEKKSFVTALLFLLQPSVLRTGWDQLREELGFLFLFVLLAKSRCNLMKYAHNKFLAMLIFSLLIVFSHQLVAVLFFVVVSWQFIIGFISEGKPSFRSLAATVPSTAIFIWQLYSQFIHPNFSDRIVPIQLPSGSEIFIFTNYFLSDPRFIGSDYWNILAHVGSLSLYVVVPLIPAIKGFFKDDVFTPMLIWLCITSYSILIFPYFAFSYYWWWILLLPIPLTVYTGNALEPMVQKSSKRLLLGFLLLGIMGGGYACSIIKLGYPYAYTYMPAGLVESCVAFEDIFNLKQVLNWVNKNIPLNATIIVPERFQGFAFIEARSDLKIYIAPVILSEAIKYFSRDFIVDYAVYPSDMIGKVNDTYNIRELGGLGNIKVYQIIRR